MTKNLKRSNTEGAQSRNLFGETRTANASVAPEVSRLQAREPQLSTRVSTKRKQETDLQGQLQNVHQEKYSDQYSNESNSNHRNSSINAINQELTQQLQTSTLEISHLQPEVCDLREIRNQTTECRNAENLRNLEEHVVLVLESLRHLAENERLIVSPQEAARETAHTQSQWEDAQHVVNSWNCAAEEMYPTGVGSGDTTPLVAADTARDTSQSTLRNFTVAGAVSSSTFVFLFLPMAGGTLMQKQERTSF